VQVQTAHVRLEKMDGQGPGEILSAMGMPGKLNIETCLARLENRPRLVGEQNGHIMIRRTLYGIGGRRRVGRLQTTAVIVGDTGQKNFALARVDKHMFVDQGLHSQTTGLLEPARRNNIHDCPCRTMCHAEP